MTVHVIAPLVYIIVISYPDHEKVVNDSNNTRYKMHGA